MVRGTNSLIFKMNCPNCKNPLTNSTTNCEWCGFKLKPEQNNLNQNLVEKNIPGSWSTMSSGKKFLMIIILILSFLFIYFQINPIT